MTRSDKAIVGVATAWFVMVWPARRGIGRAVTTSWRELWEIITTS